MNLEIWTDGSCWKSVGAYAYVMVLRTATANRVITGTGTATETTSNRCEMLGVITALEHLQKGQFNPKLVLLYSDSQYAINMLSGKYSIKPETKNTDLIYRISEVENKLKERNILLRWNWVRGHQGTEYNELADELCGSERIKLWNSLKENKKK